MISYRNFCIVCLYLIALIGTAIVQGNVEIGPSNMAVIAGKRMQMECHACNGSDVFKWMLTRTNGTEKEQIFRRRGRKIMLSKGFSHFSYDIDTQGSGYIYTNSTETTDAGVYFCYVDPGQRQFSAHLIVFEEEPFCEVNHASPNNLTVVMGERISIKCSATFTGLWIPSVEWRQHTIDSTDGNEYKVLTNEVSTISSFSSITSTLDLIADFDEPTYFSFKIFFLERYDVIPVTANNSPEFRYHWNSPEVIVIKPEIEVVTGPVIQQIVVETATVATNDAGNWYLTTVGFLAFVTLCVVTVFGFIIRRCYVGYRRIHGLDKCQLPANGRGFPALERPPSGEYDVIPMAYPNIYDRIDDGDFTEKATYAECQPQQQHQHLPLTQCYSRLSGDTMQPLDPYDALSPYLPMESTHKGPDNDPQICNGGCVKENCNKPYGSMVRGVKLEQGKSDYLDLVGEGEDQDNRTAPGRNGSAIDNSDYIHSDAAKSFYPQTHDEYLMPYL